MNTVHKGTHLDINHCRGTAAHIMRYELRGAMAHMLQTDGVAYVMDERGTMGELFTGGAAILDAITHDMEEGIAMACEACECEDAEAMIAAFRKKYEAHKAHGATQAARVTSPKTGRKGWKITYTAAA